jgi:hypothetical protein
MEMLTLFAGLCCIGIINSIGAVTGVRTPENISIYWAQFSSFHLKTEAESSLSETSCFK